MKLSNKVSIMVVIALIGILLCTALADSMIYRYSYISTINATLRIHGNTASATGIIVPSSSYATDISVMLQQQQSDGSWVTITSWSGSNASGYSEAGGSTTVITGYTYRTYVIGHVYDSENNVIDTGTAYKY